MPRTARKIIANIPHYINQRGNNTQDIFFVDDDCNVYLEILKEQSEKYGLAVMGYCLMANHVHLIATPHAPDSVSKAVGRTHFIYTQYINRFHNRSGHLWQGRFYSCPLDEGHLYEAVRYVENNPVRAKLAKDAIGWEFSSARSHLGCEESVLPMADIKEYVAADDWSAYLKEKCEQAIIEKIKANTLTGRPSGSDRFVAGLEKRFGMRLRPLPEGRPAIKVKN